MYVNEAEQVEQLKKWVNEYGASLIVGVFLALVIGFGWRFWQQRQEQQLEHASVRYEQLLTNVVNGNTTAVESQALRLMTRYPHTPYAQLAALQLARQQVYQDDYSGAQTQLTWVMKHGNNPALREVARLRVARLQLAQNKTEDALTTLDKIEDKSYLPAINIAKGDVLLALGKTTEAAQAYQAAMTAFPGLDEMQPILSMKIDNLVGATNTTK